LQLVAWRLVRHFCSRKFPEFVINQGQQFLRGFGVPLLDAVEDVGDVAHPAELMMWGTDSAALFNVRQAMSFRAADGGAVPGFEVDLAKLFA
jgi:hypothetical protein